MNAEHFETFAKPFLLSLLSQSLAPLREPFYGGLWFSVQFILSNDLGVSELKKTSVLQESKSPYSESNERTSLVEGVLQLPLVLAATNAKIVKPPTG